MKLTAVFETWHIGDGNYPPFYKGMAVNLSFELMPEQICKTENDRPEVWKQLEDAQYEFCGRVLKTYSIDEPIVVVQLRDFCCYINSFPDGTLKLAEGDRIEGFGRLLLDHYIWVEYFDRYEAAPDLFYNLSVERIRAVTIPESFIHRSEGGFSHPCSLRPGEYAASDVLEVEEMQEKGCQLYLVDFDSGHVAGQIPRTFL